MKSPVKEQVAKELGVDRTTINSRLKSASETLGLDKPLDLDTSPTEDLAAASRALKARDREKADRGKQLSLHVYPGDPAPFARWLRGKHPDPFSLDQLRGYRDALVELVRELES